jgi:hypothetical protein
MQRKVEDKRVIAIASTPSLNASVRFLLIARLPAVASSWSMTVSGRRGCS